MITPAEPLAGSEKKRDGPKVKREREGMTSFEADPDVLEMLKWAIAATKLSQSDLIRRCIRGCILEVTESLIPEHQREVQNAAAELKKMAGGKRGKKKAGPDVHQDPPPDTRGNVG